jgi:hypothetical protein
LLVFRHSAQPKTEEPGTCRIYKNGTPDPMLVQHPCQLLKRWFSPMQLIAYWHLEPKFFPYVRAGKHD